MNLALFDLDHTLIPFDSGMAWTHFLIGRGVLPPQAEDRYLAYCRQYVEGTLDIREMHRASVTPLAAHSLPTLRAWGREFEAAVHARVPASTRALVRAHRKAGDLCLIVTATTRLVAEPFARLFGVEHLLATESAVEAEATGGEARLTGEIDGEPCYREHKATHLQRWLGARGRTLSSFPRSWFYSDSISDLPLLQVVTHPVAVHPDPRLRAHAQAKGWRVLEPGRE